MNAGRIKCSAYNKWANLRCQCQCCHFLLHHPHPTKFILILTSSNALQCVAVVHFSVWLWLMRMSALFIKIDSNRCEVANTILHFHTPIFVSTNNKTCHFLSLSHSLIHSLCHSRSFLRYPLTFSHFLFGWIFESFVCRMTWQNSLTKWMAFKVLEANHISHICVR